MQQRSDIPTEPQSSSPVRLLAPIALVLTAIAVIIVISSSLGGDGSSPSSSEGGGGGGGGAAQSATTTKSEKPPKRYEVQSGDSLSAIAERFDVPVEDLLELNRDIDPQALSTGQTLKLR